MGEEERERRGEEKWGEKGRRYSASVELIVALCCTGRRVLVVEVAEWSNTVENEVSRCRVGLTSFDS